MTRLDDRLHRAANELQRAARAIPARTVPIARRPLIRAVRWAATAIGLAALIALPLWLGFSEEQGGPAGDPTIGREIDDEAFLRGDADLIAFLAEELTPTEAGLMIHDISLWEGVAGVMYKSRDSLIVAGDVLENDPPIWDVVFDQPSDPSTIRLKLGAGADHERLAGLLALVPGVVGVADAGGEAMPVLPREPSLAALVRGVPFNDDLILSSISSPAPLPGTALLVASTEQAGLGTIFFVVYEADPKTLAPPPPSDGPFPERWWYCYASVVVNGAPSFGGATGCGTLVGLLTPGAFLQSECDHATERHILTIRGLSPYGIEPDTGPVTITFSDGSSETVEVVNGTILLAWDGGKRPTSVEVDGEVPWGLRPGTWTSGNGC